MYMSPRTPLGRARAWLRLALMQKRLADYLRLLITRKDLLRYMQREYAAICLLHFDSKPFVRINGEVAYQIKFYFPP